jgi:transcriptional regulator with XRE-family HTH domain
MREWLKTARREKKLTMKDMAAALGISESYYCAIENGERQKRLDIMVASTLAEVLGVSVAEIIRREAENPQ